MNDNSVGTPNPLNPAPAAEPAAPAPVAEPVSEPVVPKKKQTGLIVSLIIGLIVLIGGAVAAVLVLFVFNKSADAVPAAIAKVISGEAKDYAISGTITAAGDDSSAFGGVSLTLDAKINTASMTNSITADVNTSISGMDLYFTFDERTVSKDKMFIKIDGVTDSITDLMMTMLEENGIDCDEMDCDALIDQMMEGAGSQFALISNIEGEWLHIDSSEFSGIGSNVTDNTSQCLIDAMSSASKYGDDIAALYKDNSFVTYSTENIPITKKKDTIYKLGLDFDKMANFANAMQTSAFANDLKACVGETATNKNVTAADLEEVFTNFPVVYAEIDNNNNFTRLYFSAEAINLVADLSISYPGTITVEAPSSYLEASEYLTDLLQTFGGFSSYETVEDDELVFSL